MNPPIKYFGGKGTMYKKIIEHFPLNYTTYIEPFGGSYSVGFRQPHNCVEIYNDIEKNVYCLFKVLSDKDLFNKFKNFVDLLPYSQDLRKEYKEDLKTKNLSILDRAIRFFYVNRTSHNGIGGFSINNVIRRGMSKSTSDFLSAVDGLNEIHQRLSKVIVMNVDGIDLINRYSYPETFIYCDPPYLQSTRTMTRYLVDMEDDKHDELIEALLQSKAQILLSGYDNEKYEKLSGGFEKIMFEVNIVDGNRRPKSKTECLWKNY